MKTTYSLAEAKEIISNASSDADLSTITQMDEGHSSQVFMFTTAIGKSLVFRIRDSLKDLEADKFAHNRYGNYIPIPDFIASGHIDAHTCFAITKHVDGQTLSTLSETEFNFTLGSFQKNLAAIYNIDISNGSGYGDIDTNTGDSPSVSWKESLENELIDLNPENLRKHSEAIGLEHHTVDKLVAQLYKYLPYVSEKRRLLHGDPGGDNVIVRNNEIVAFLDWEQMAYGDWVRDFSRFGYWGLRDYGDIDDFGKKFGLEIENIHERKAVYWAINSLRNIEFTARISSEKGAKWLRTHIEEKII